MIELGNKAVDAPPVHSAGEGALSPGSVYVADGTLQPGLPEGKHVVLSAGQTLELTSRSTIGAAVTATGTYLQSAEYSQVGNWSNPTVRLYTAKDTWHKIWSPSGILLLITTLAGVVAGLAGLIGIWGGSPTDAAAVSDRAQTALQWSVAPVEQLDSSSSGAQVVAARQAVQRRSTQAAQCLALLEGRAAPQPNVPGVDCQPSSPRWWKNKDTVTWITLIVGALTALLSVVGLRKNFGFGKIPASN